MLFVNPMSCLLLSHSSTILFSVPLRSRFAMPVLFASPAVWEREGVEVGVGWGLGVGGSGRRGGARGGCLEPLLSPPTGSLPFTRARNACPTPPPLGPLSPFKQAQSFKHPRCPLHVHRNKMLLFLFFFFLLLAGTFTTYMLIIVMHTVIPLSIYFIHLIRISFV